MTLPSFGTDLIVTSFAAYAGQTNILLQADRNVIFSAGPVSLPSLPAGAPVGQLTVQAGNNITLNAGSAMIAGNNWNVTFSAGTALPAGVSPPSGSYGIYLNGTAYLQTLNGAISLAAANEIIVNGGAIRTLGGGSIGAVAQYGDVNAGASTVGFVYNHTTPPYYAVSGSLGGIGTAAGGDVTMIAGGNVFSYLPTSASGSSGANDAGSGAFGPAPGNVSITAGGGVFGHYVVANGTGTITAGQNIGSSAASQNVALSLVKGSWNLNAPNGSIYLQEARNPNGMFNNFGSGSFPSYHLFDYDPNASVSLAAGAGVYLTGLSLPRTSVAVPLTLPPTFIVQAGSGGAQIAGDIRLFPSPNGQLNITVSNHGSLASSSGAPIQIILSDSGASQYTTGASFGPTDHASTPVHLHDPTPVQLNVSGDLNDIVLVAPKAAQVSVGGNMLNSGFMGQNLNPSDISSFAVAGDILNTSEFTSVTLSTPPNLGAFSHAVNQPSGLTAAGAAGLASRLFYDPIAHSLRLQGRMSAQEQVALVNLTVRAVDPVTGTPLVDGLGNPILQVVQVINSNAAQLLYTQSQTIPGQPGSGCVIAGPGALDLSARNLDLGFSAGIQSVGAANNPALAPLCARGAGINLNLGGNLNLASSAIASLAGGNITVAAQGSISVGLTGYQAQNQAARGIFTSSKADVSVTAVGDITLSGSPVATYDGGNILIHAINGNLDASFPGTNWMYVTEVSGNPVQTFSSYFPGAGILATTFPQSAETPGNITIRAGQNILLGCGAASQFSGNGTSGNAGVINLQAGGNVIQAAAGCVSVVGDGSLTVTAGGAIGGFFTVIGAGSVDITASGASWDLLNAQTGVTNLTAQAGTNVQFSVNAAGLAPFGYQWYKDGSSLADATNASLTLPNVRRLDAGTYSVVVTNLVGSITNDIQLRVLVPQLLSAFLAQTNHAFTVSFGDSDGSPLAAQDIPGFVVQTSTNLVDWTPTNLPISTNATGKLYFQLDPSVDPGQGYYRVLSQ